MISATSPNQEGVEGTDAEEVWMITEESAILVMSTSFIGKDLYPSLKGGTFYVCSLQATSRCAIRGSRRLERKGAPVCIRWRWLTGKSAIVRCWRKAIRPTRHRFLPHRWARKDGP